MNTELHSFATLVKNMRNAQNNYFKYRDKHTLATAKRYEKFVDDEVKKIIDVQEQQTQLALA